MLDVVLNDWVIDTNDTPLIEQLDQLGEGGERAGEAVDLIDHHDGDLASPDIGQELLQGRAVEGGSREAAIVIAVWNQAPALMRLALDVGLAGLPLGIERVEFEIEIVLGRFAGVVGLPARCLHYVGNGRALFAVEHRKHLRLYFGYDSAKAAMPQTLLETDEN